MADSRKQRKPNFTDGEIICLLEMYSERKNVLQSHLTNSVTNRQKQEEWRKIAAVINSRSAGVTRDIEEIKKKWKDLLRKAKRDVSAMKNPATGGGPQPKESTYTSWVLDIIGTDSSSLVGIEEGVESAQPDTVLDLSQTSTGSPVPSTSAAALSSPATLTTLPVPPKSTLTNDSCLPRASPMQAVKRKATSQSTDDLYRQLLTLEIARAKAETERANAETERAREETVKVQLEIKLLQRQLEAEVYTIPIQTISES